MIGLDTKIKAQAGGGTEFKPIPDGSYPVEIVQIDAWKPSTRDIYVIQKDSNGKNIKKNNKNVTELVKDYTFYNASVRFSILEGEFAGQLIFDNVTTHPNALFKVQNLLYAVDLAELTLKDLQKKALNTQLEIEVKNKKNIYDKETTNPDTGLVTTEHIENMRPEVKAYRRLLNKIVAPKEVKLKDLDNDINW